MVRPLPVLPISLPTPWPSVGPVHTYLIREDPVTLVDAGLNDADSRQTLLCELKKAGVGVKDIRRVLITHAHLDHYGQAAWVQAESGAEVYMHPDEAAKAESPEWYLAQRDRALQCAGVPANVRLLMSQIWEFSQQWAIPLNGWKRLADGERFAFEHGVLEAIHLPGHALGHTGFMDPAAGLLIGGDHLLDGVTPNPILEPVQEGHPAAAAHAPDRALTLGLFLGALTRVSALPVLRVLPGHGPDIPDHAAVAERYRATHERRLELMREKIGRRMTPYGLTRILYPRVRDFNIFLAVSEVLAHLDLLVDRNLAAVEPSAEGNCYRAT